MENSVMLLCDIGNTSLHFLDTQKSEYKEFVKDFDPSSIKQKTYYISVNKLLSTKLQDLSNWIDLEEFIDKSKYYKTMGIDRIVAVEAVSNAVVVDAGSALTVDVVRDGIYEGGFIYPGRKAMQKCYKGISPALEYTFNFELEQNHLAKNSQDAISYGYLKLLVSEVSSFGLPIIVTGGDAREFVKLFENATLNNRLLFEGMQKIIAQL